MQDSQEVEIEISNPETRQELGGANKFQVYFITGQDHHGVIENNRRYSDFVLLRDILMSRWPGFYIPTLPVKKTIGANQSNFIQSRRRGLKYFLTTLSKNKHLWNSTQMQIFLRNTNGTSDKQISMLAKEGKEKLLQRYQVLFPSYQTDNQQSKSKFLQFSAFLREVRIILQKLQKQSELMAESCKKALQKKYIFLQFLLPDYQKNCILSQDEKGGQGQNLLFLCSEQNGIKECMQKYKKSNQYMSIYFVSQQIKREKREVESFLDILKNKDEYESLRLKTSGKVKDLQIEQSKIQSGKQSLLSKIKNKSKDEQLLSNKVESLQAQTQETLYLKLCQLINNILIKEEIDRFRSIRRNAYYDLLRNFMTAEKQVMDLERDLWVQVGRHDMIGIEEENSLVKKQIEVEYKPVMQVIDEDQTNEQEEQQQEVVKNGKKYQEQEIVHDEE